MTLLVGYHLLDRQVIGSDGLLIGKVDNVEISAADPPRVVALLLGPQAFADRIGGRLGRIICHLARRLQPGEDPTPLRVPYPQVDHVDTAVHLRIRSDELPEPALKSWLRKQLIDRIPGAHHGE